MRLTLASLQAARTLIAYVVNLALLAVNLTPLQLAFFHSVKSKYGSISSASAILKTFFNVIFFSPRSTWPK